MIKKYFYITISNLTILLTDIVLIIASSGHYTFFNFASFIREFNWMFMGLLYLIPLIFIAAIIARIVGGKLSKKYSDDQHIKIANIINTAIIALIAALVVWIFFMPLRSA